MTVKTKTTSNTDNLYNWKVTGLFTSAIIAILLLIFYSTTSSMVSVWLGSETYKHCLLILPIVLFLLWEKKALFSQTSPKLFTPGILLIPLVGLGWLIARITGVNFGEHLMLVALIQVIILTMVGYRAYWTFLFPFSYLWFLIPFGEFLVPHLQTITTWFSVFFLNLANIPNFNDGVFISIPSGDFEVAEACAGIRFLIATVVLGFLFAYLFYRSTFKRLVFVVLSIVIPIVANGFRAFGIIFIAYMTDHKYAVGVDHLVYGWFFFAFVLALLIGIGLLFRDDVHPEKNKEFAFVSNDKISRKALSFSAMIIICFLILPVSYAHHLEVQDFNMKDYKLTHLITPQSGWDRNTCHADWNPEYTTPKSEKICLKNNETNAEIFIGFYPTQNTQYEAYSYHNKNFNDGLWRRKNTVSGLIQVNKMAIPIVTDKIWTPMQQEFYITKFYWINGEFVQSPLKMKLLRLLSQVKNGNQAAFVFLVKMPIDPLKEGQDQNQAMKKNIENLLNSIENFTQNLEDMANDSYNKTSKIN